MNKGRRRTIGWIGGLAAAVAVALALTHHGGTGGRAKIASPTRAESAPPATTPLKGTASTKPVRVGMESALIRQMFLPTVAEFADSGVVDRVVMGTIKAIHYGVGEDAAHLIYTTYTVQPTSVQGQPAGSPVTVFEGGGIVPLRAVRSDFEDKGIKIPADELDRPIDVSDGPAHPVVGESTLIFVSKTDPGPGTVAEYGALARMTYDAKAGMFRWAGEAPNPEWSSTTLTSDQVVEQFGRLIEAR